MGNYSANILYGISHFLGSSRTAEVVRSLSQFPRLTHAPPSPQTERAENRKADIRCFETR